MAAAFSDYLEDIIIDHLLRKVDFTPPEKVYLALFTGDTGLEANAPEAEVSTSGTAYARKEVALDAASGGVSANTSDIEFEEATGDWGTITHVALVDHATNTNWGTGVNVLMWAELTTSKEIGSGDTFRIKAGDLNISVD
jgi:hypothetical protein